VTATQVLVLSRPWKMDDWHSEHMLLFLLP